MEMERKKYQKSSSTFDVRSESYLKLDLELIPFLAPNDSVIIDAGKCERHRTCHPFERRAFFPSSLHQWGPRSSPNYGHRRENNSSNC